MTPAFPKWAVLFVVVACVDSCQLNFHWRKCVCCLCAAGSMIDRITVFCSSAQELQEWLEHLQPFTKGGSPASTISKVRMRTFPQTHTHSDKHTHAYSIKSQQYQKWTLHHAEVWKPFKFSLWGDKHETHLSSHHFHTLLVFFSLTVPCRL